MEARGSNTDLVKELKQWCCGEGMDETHSLMVLVPAGVEISQIEQTMETIKALGRVRVRGRMFNQRHNLLSVLCECKEAVDSHRVPSEVLPEGETKAWSLVMASGEAEVGNESQGASEPSGIVASDGSAESIIRAVGDLLVKIEKPSGEGSGYRRLRLFSGTLPIPAGEEALDHWLEHARLMVEEVTAKEKR